MSADIYIACDKCKSALWCAQTGLSGFTFYSREPECMSALGRWLRAHYLCETKPHIDFEQNIDEDLGWTIVEWSDA